MKFTLFSKVNELNAEIAQVRLRTDKNKDNFRKTNDELSAVKKARSDITNT